jgi:hypothetical protein
VGRRWWACYYGHVRVATALLNAGADFSIADCDDVTPLAVAKRVPDDDVSSAEGRRECVVALEVRTLSYALPLCSITCSSLMRWLRRGGFPLSRS